ncbi:MAG: hypothetical protein QOH96_2558 [Blastocatellia bacterium]|nr:hypothetical protein [Blastocatellia bacterium]
MKHRKSPDTVFKVYSRIIQRRRVAVVGALLVIILALTTLSACKPTGAGKSIIPRSMAEVPAEKLAYRFEPDVPAPQDSVVSDDPNKKLEAIQTEFDSKRKDDALVRTVVSPDGKRALALYETGQNNPGEYRVDLYTADGTFLRNITPPDFAGAFPQIAAWSPNGEHIIFAGRRTVTPKPSPTPDEPLPSDASIPSPTPSVAPLFTAIPLFNTEQIYICDQDGFNLKPLTNREGLIYFGFDWAPDGKAITALACKDDEWYANEKAHKPPRGRPRLIGLDANERLLDDGLTEAVPSWSLDGTKIATAFGTDVKIYDVGSNAPSQALISINDSLMEASAEYDIQLDAKNKPTRDAKATLGSNVVGTPVSFNPIVKVAWQSDNELYLKTAFIRLDATEPVVTFQRWHLLHLSPQAALMGKQPPKS